MRRRIARANRLIWAATLVCLAAAGHLAWQVWRPDAAPPESPAPVAEEAAPPSASEDREEGFVLADANEYADIVDRPLFTRSRRPSPAGVKGGGAEGGAGGAGEVAAANLTLAGVLLTRSRRVALVRIDNDPKLVHLGEGQLVGGWLIEKIQPDRVILRRGESSNEVVLDYRRHPEGGPQPHGLSGVRPGRGPERPPGPPPPDQEDEEPTE